MNIVQEARSIIYNSSILKYIEQDKLEQAFNRIYVYQNEEDFQRKFGSDLYKNERLEGFNRSDGSHLGPTATTHTVIHEVLHNISSEFDSEGHRIKNGLMGDTKYAFSNQVNEGVTDYLAAKLSGEKPRHYLQGHKFFPRLEAMLIKYTNNPDILMQMYCNNDVKFMQDFLNYFGKKDTFENLYNNFLFMNDQKIKEMLDGIEKGLNKYLKKQDRKEKRQKVFSKLKALFKRNEAKMLPENTLENEQNSVNEFKERYNAQNFQSSMEVPELEENEQQNKQKEVEEYIK